MKHRRNWAIGIILAASAGFVALQNVTAPAVPPSPATDASTIIIPTDTPIATPAYEGCGYMWAYHDSPELTEQINTAIRGFNPDATARAELFGEDCVYADGTSTFGAMETDFYVQLPVDNLTDEEAFGNWIAQAMPVVVQIPKEEIEGNYGFVEFTFIKSDTERIVVRVPISTYLTDAEKSGAELFRFFYIPPVNPT
jgi:hypothetical protein